MGSRQKQNFSVWIT